MKRTLVVVHNNIDDSSSIGAFAAWAVRAGLERNWAVTAVCRDLASELAAEVDHRPLYVPPRLHLLQWTVARPTVRVALRGWRPDAMLVYQPQLAAIADVWHVEYLSRAARQAGSPREAGGRAAVRDAQAAGVAVLEDRYVRRIPAETRLLFCSDGLRDQFTEIYGPSQNCGVLYNPALGPSLPPGRRLPDAELRARLTGGHDGPVVGFLGGGDARKGADLVLDAVAADPEMFLIHAGPSTMDDSDARLRGRTRAMGHLRDVTELLDAIDVLLVPSRFEPFGLVVAEAAARGVPVLVDSRVGAAPLVLETGAGAIWSQSEPLGPAVARLVANRPGIAAAGRALTDRLAPSLLADQLFAELDGAVERRRRRSK